MANVKAIVRDYFGFVNFRTMVELYTWRLWRRRNRTFFIFEGKEYSYGEVYRQSRRYADFFLSERKKAVADGRLGKTDRLALGIYMENNPEFIFASFGAGLSNSIAFAINTGFRGETLARVIEKAGITLLIVSESTAGEVERSLPTLEGLDRGNILLVGEEAVAREKEIRSLEEALSAPRDRLDRRDMPPIDNTSPVLVIYTSGTTGTPKGVPCAHMKLWGAGMVVKRDAHLTGQDRGYICMPLFHSNSWYVGLLALLVAGGSFVLKRRFSASAFEADILEHGVTFMNYVGQPLHYIISALEKQYGSGEEVQKALARHPRNRFRIAYGNGATAVDREKLTRYLAMDHVYEIYGSTEAVITTANKPGDPIESVGVAHNTVCILDAAGKECPPGVIDEKGRLTNYDQAVGEIARRIGAASLRFDGYFADQGATGKKIREGTYYSGDLGHIRIVNGKRYLFFNGRTDDWIRKDGENFSAENVLAYAQSAPGVDLAIAYGAPGEVADEKVMVALQLKPGGVFEPDTVFEWYMRQQQEGGMDPKWMPDYLRIVDTFPVLDTQKIVVRPYKRESFDIESNPDMVIYYRERGDITYKLLTSEGYQKIKQAFESNGRMASLLHN